MGFPLQWVSLSLILIGAVNVLLADTVYDALGRRKDLSKFHEMVNRDELLRRLLQRYPITVFAPTNEAINRNKEWVLGRENSVVSYHILTLFANKSSFPFVYATSLPGSPPLYGGVKRYPGSRKVEYFANNAKIIDSKEYTSTEGENQILYVIDDILEPYVSSTSMPPSAYDLLSHPEQHDIKEPLSAFNSRVKQEQLEELFKREGNHTFFLPVAAGQGHSFNRHQGVDKWVIRGHVIPRNVLFTRLATLDQYQSEAYGDDIQVELSIINQSNAIGNSYTLYAQSSTTHSDYRHKKGVVMAKILKPNIPVKNGVVHLIESPLMIVDITVWQFLQNEKKGRLSEFMELVNFAPGFKELLNSSQEKSLFAPTNEAIRQLPPEAIGTIKTNITAITNLLKLHLVMKSISTDDVLYGRYREYVSADNRNSLYFRILGDEKNKTLTVDGVGVKAAAVQADIGAIDGMMHIIDRLLGMPYQTVFLKLLSDPDLRITYELSEQDGWSQILSGNDKRFTFFAPSDDAWMQLKRNMPTVYKQLTMKAFPYHTKKILDRHLVVNRELRSSDLERINEIQMVHGRFKVIHLDHPGGELLLEWEGRQARIVRPDVQTVNGVIHVIDRVMMMRHDLTKSGASIGPLSNGFLSIIPAFFFSRHLSLKTCTS